jgi:hypothetical protein
METFPPILNVITHKDSKMKQDLLFKFWFILSGVVIVSLSYWAIFFVEKTEHQIAIFGIVAAIITAITSVITVTLNSNKQKERELDLIIVKEKQKVFEHFYNALFEILKTVKQGKAQGSSKNAEQEMMEFKRGLMNWGSEELIQKYLDYEHNLIQSQSNKDHIEMIKNADRFLKDLRKEMGFKDTDKINIYSIIMTAEARDELNLISK